MTEDKFNYYQFMDELKEDFIYEIENDFVDTPTDDEITDRITEFADSKTPIYYSDIINMSQESMEHWDMFYHTSVDDMTVVEYLQHCWYEIINNHVYNVAYEYIEARNKRTAIAEEE